MDTTTSPLTAPPGTRRTARLPVGSLPNGSGVDIPVTVVRGSTDGPTFVAQAGVHGDEYLGTDVVRHVIASLDPERLRGRFVGVLQANPAAAGTRTRRGQSEAYPGPHDMNRVFPGNSAGLLAERAAHRLVTDVYPLADYFVDLHCASLGGQWHAYATVAAEPDEDVRAFATAFGAPTLLAGPAIPGSSVEAAARLCRRSTMVEFGVAGAIDPVQRAAAVTGVLRMLHLAGMYDTAPKPAPEPTTITRLHRLAASAAGFLTHTVELGTVVAEGDRLAVVEDLHGEVVEEFHAPAAGLVCRRNTLGLVGTGDLVVYVGEVRA